MENKVGCSAGRTILIDPNTFDGQSSTSNISVPLEDLSIYVQLETTKKARTILTNNGMSNTIASTDGAIIRFIEGDEVGGKKVLTSSYTDLTTDLSDNNQQQALGITSIDIDFNTSNAPMIVINFIDLRGSAIFQNEENITDSQNKYSEFFNLPYPIFTLTVKGYYGMPVKYNLHMTKFNAKFNSATGNFEITANFVGYTYAMLSDMLIGYLRAVAYTPKGMAKYNHLKQTRGGVLTLDELAQKISAIDSEVSKLNSNDPDVADLHKLDSKLTLLSDISSNIMVFGQNIGNVGDTNELKDYNFVVKKSDLSDDNLAAATSEYNSIVGKNVIEFNTDAFSNITLNENDLSVVNMKVYKDITMKLVSPENEKNNATLIKAKGITNPNELFNFGRKNGVPLDSVITVYDFRNQIQIVNDTKLNLKKESNIIKKEVADKLRDTISTELKFNPSIRNIVSCFTTAVEVLMDTLFEVSNEAKVNTERKNTLDRKFKMNESAFDIHSESINLIPANSSSGNMEKNFYPWPEYREYDEKVGLIEKYLGDGYVLTTDEISTVTELNFINDLLKAFIESDKIISNLEITSEINSSSWLPVNPLDTRLFIDKFPYKRIQGNTRDEVIALMLERAFIYMGYTNYNLSPEEITNIANSESDSVLNFLDNTIIKNSLTQLSRENFYNVMALQDGALTKIMDRKGSEYYYNYIYNQDPNSQFFSTNVKKILPISSSEGNGFSYEFKPNEDTLLKADDGMLFLSNYVSTPVTGVNITPKIDDGGVYVKIISSDEYQNSIKTIQNDSTDSVLLLSELEKEQETFNNNTTQVGFSQFSGPYGIQDYKILNFGVDTMEKSEYRIMFYDDTSRYVSNSVFARKRTKGKTTTYDITGNSVKVMLDFNNVADDIIGNNSPHDSMGKNRLLLNDLIENKADNVSFPFVSFQMVDDYFRPKPMGLFGSRFYNQQEDSRPYKFSSDYAKAFLFLHSLPWNGLLNGKESGIFNVNEILNTFGNRGGFISAPKLWCAFIGGLLWRADTNKPTFYPGTKLINGGGSGEIDPIRWHDGVEGLIPTYTIKTKTPERNEYLNIDSRNETYMLPMSFKTDGFLISMDYNKIEDFIFQLPDQVKNEFKKSFFNFVSVTDGNSDWNNLKPLLEVYNGGTNEWKNSFNLMMTNVNVGGGLKSDGTLDKIVLDTLYNNEHDGKLTLNDYIIFSPYYNDGDFKYNFFTELKDDSEGVRMLLSLLSDEVYIANTTYRIWQKKDTENSFFTKNYNGSRNSIIVSNENMNRYIDAVIAKFKPIEKTTPENQKKKQENEIFGTDNENIIKFQLYRTCKNIYDKWIGGSDSLTNLMFCRTDLRNSIDHELAIKDGRRGDIGLIDSFRFVNRSFKDIGDDMIVNPTVVLDFIKNNQNSSFYDVVTSLLSANNFDFIPLPSFVNYSDSETLRTIFKPMTTLDAFDNGEIGPSFVCVYVGQPSKNLDFKGSEYPNDGVDFRCDSDGNLMTTLAKDFYTQKEDYENNVAVFGVNYSQQNQNIFKDITLDQSEFTETAESLKIIDDIANKGSENRRTYGGQNMYNVYSVRSYSSEVEMLGNAMIQPMMYYQLNNIPMFHGAYLIIHVKHSIKPNYMTTTFNGVRIRNVETKLIDKSEFYMSLLASIGIDGIDTEVDRISSNTPVVYSGESAADRPPKKEISCNTVTKNVNSFDEILKLIIDNLEGSYYSGNINQFTNKRSKELYKNSGQTLWGLDRKRNINKKTKVDNMPILEQEFWKAVDKIEDKTKWNLTKFPKPKDYPELYKKYIKVFEHDYNRDTKLLTSELKRVIQSDGRLYFNMVYATYNGSDWSKKFGLLLQKEYDSGKRTSDELLKVFVNARVGGGRILYPNINPNSAIIIADTGVDIEKMVGLGLYCNKPLIA